MTEKRPPRWVQYLRGFDSQATNYGEAYLDLIHHLRESIESDDHLQDPQQECLRNLTIGMSIWHTVIRDIQS